MRPLPQLSKRSSIPWALALIAPACASSRDKTPTSTRSRTPSPGSRRCCAEPPSARSTPFGMQSPASSTPTPRPNSPTPSPLPDMIQPIGLRSNRAVCSLPWSTSLRKSVGCAPRNPATTFARGGSTACPGPAAPGRFRRVQSDTCANGSERGGGTVCSFRACGLVGQAVEQRACKAIVAERRRRLIEGQVRGDDRGAALITLADQLEQEFRPGPRKRHEIQPVAAEEGP